MRKPVWQKRRSPSSRLWWLGSNWHSAPRKRASHVRRAVSANDPKINCRASVTQSRESTSIWNAPQKKGSRTSKFISLQLRAALQWIFALSRLPTSNSHTQATLQSCLRGPAGAFVGEAAASRLKTARRPMNNNPTAHTHTLTENTFPALSAPPYVM